MAVAKEFRDFILRGNVVDLAVGVVIGAAFGAVVTAFVKDIITPIISIPGTTNFNDLYWQVGGAKFLVGDFINTLISFLVIALVIFFFVVKPVNMLMKRFKPTQPEPETTHECPYCLSKVPLQATRCAFCTSDLKAAV
ncbi:MAG TPA: large conductance mechanosensitive channel protein MscL [Chloroflexia bacterium]|nr:large conductance mechanosensitive channel protein MscL [Chloroflexia bacterium]